MILLDTHVVIWLALEPDRISRRARAVIEEARSHGLGLAISDISLLEIAAIVSKGRVTLNASLETFLSEIEARFAVFPMTGRVCALAQQLPASYRRDPADRVIGATSLVEGIPLVTADREIHRSKALRTVW